MCSNNHVPRWTADSTDVCKYIFGALTSWATQAIYILDIKVKRRLIQLLCTCMLFTVRAFWVTMIDDCCFIFVPSSLPFDTPLLVLKQRSGLDKPETSIFGCKWAAFQSSSAGNLMSLFIKHKTEGGRTKNISMQETHNIMPKMCIKKWLVCSFQTSFTCKPVLKRQRTFHMLHCDIKFTLLLVCVYFAWILHNNNIKCPAKAQCKSSKQHGAARKSLILELCAMHHTF
jgi:hypothetical protein